MADPVIIELAVNGATPRSANPGAMVKLYFGGALEFGLPPADAALEAYLELLAEVVALVERLGRAPADSAQARKIIGVPGR